MEAKVSSCSFWATTGLVLLLLSSFSTASALLGVCFAALQRLVHDGTRRSLAAENIEKIHAVNLGGWLLIEKWITPELFNGIANNDLLDGTQIQLRSVKLNTYVAADGGGGGKLVVDRASASGWETFKLWRVSSTTFQLRVFNSKFVSAENGGGGSVTATRDTPSGWETFEMIRNQKRVQLKAFNGQFLQAKDQSQLTADYNGQPNWDDSNPAVFEMNVNTVLGGEYQLANGYGSSEAPAVFQKHWDTYITEDDFKSLESKQINAVRIPVGWWIASDPNPPAPFVSGSLRALDSAFQWGEAHNIKIIVDLHAAPGAQNPWEHGGSRDGVPEWANSDDNRSQTIKVIEFLASRYANRPGLLGIELLNEPRAQDVPLETLKTYYNDGYSAVRRHSSSAYVFFCQRIGGDPSELVNLMKASDKAVLDVHFYSLYSSECDLATVQENIDCINSKKKQQVQSLNDAGGASIFVGEWTNEWNVQGASDSDYKKFGDAQLSVYGQASFGWAYWTLKNPSSHWDFQKSVDKYLPRNSNGGWPS